MQRILEEGGDPNSAEVKALNDDLEVNDGKQDDNQGPDFDGVDDRAMYCFLEVGLQTGTLRTEMTDKDCIFLVNLINEENLKAVPYES